MIRQHVISSDLVAVGYDADKQVLEIEFLDGSVYQYSHVPMSIHQGLMAASSHGRYFHAHIRGRYSYIRIV